MSANRVTSVDIGSYYYGNQVLLSSFISQMHSQVHITIKGNNNNNNKITLFHS